MTRGPGAGPGGGDGMWRDWRLMGSLAAVFLLNILLILLFQT